ncbi:XdhC family protein [Luteibacter sahnii]|uniref:XdhC family protein n=1 Tax=Luteibacter sahnii TaxID=3021977 RepID=UPI002A6A0F77|nr:XdhC family protein [Luteibacter sp. PPL193]MDY1548737.1 XdhC family protein [Luteibacter sp. PPL193]
MNSADEFRTLVDALLALRERGGRGALATLTRTRGSTFRRVGARMLVHEDGDVVCELSGGCPQRDIVERALEAMREEAPRLLHYNAQNGLDLMMDMGCGGELEVMVEPLAPPRPLAVLDVLADGIARRRSGRLVTLFALDGLPVMPRRQVWLDGALRHDEFDDDALGDIVAGLPPDDGHRAATLALLSPRGRADVLVEPLRPPHRLVLVGSGATARAMLPLAAALGWAVTLVEANPDRLRDVRAVDGVTRLCAGPGTVMATILPDAQTSVVVMTHNFEQDMAYLRVLQEAPLAYLGTLGSRERARRVFEDGRFARTVHAPAGLDIGSESPAEIALAITAEIVATRRGHAGGSLRDGDGAIH